MLLSRWMTLLRFGGSMRLDEAFYRLVTLSTNGFDAKDYTDALKTIMDLTGYDKPIDDESCGSLFFSERMNPHIRMTSLEDFLKEYVNVIPVKYYPYSDLFYDCFGLVYKHWNGPDTSPEYELPLEYYDFDSLRSDVLKKESTDYFLTKKDMVLIPSYETDELFVWQVFIKEPYEKFYVGRMIVEKS